MFVLTTVTRDCKNGDLLTHFRFSRSGLLGAWIAICCKVSKLIISKK